MTELRQGSKVTRKLVIQIQRRPLVITLHPGGIEMRRLGTRASLFGTYEGVFTYLSRLAADKAIAEKKAAKKAKRSK